jgi:hypothetical protein
VKVSKLHGLQAKLDLLQTQFRTLLAEQNKIKNTKPPPMTSGKLTGAPKPEENETRTINGTK